MPGIRLVFLTSVMLAGVFLSSCSNEPDREKLQTFRKLVPQKKDAKYVLKSMKLKGVNSETWGPMILIERNGKEADMVPEVQFSSEGRLFSIVLDEKLVPTHYGQLWHFSQKDARLSSLDLRWDPLEVKDESSRIKFVERILKSLPR